jgi:catechol 2,3-dioxygenase-like lactoylglutathione lyase family enzyme
MKHNALVPVLYVTSTKKTLEFYTKILGFHIEYQREEEGFAYLSMQGLQIMICQIDIGASWITGELVYPLGRGINFQMEVKEIKPILSNLQENNIKLYMEPKDTWYRKDDTQVGNRQFLVQDPDGYLLRFFEDLGSKPL